MKLYNTYPFLLIGCTGLIGGGLGVFGTRIFLESSPLLWIYVVVGILFIGELITFIVIDENIDLFSSGQIAFAYLLLKAVKLLVFIVILAIYTWMIKVEVMRFLGIAVMFYFIYLFMDTLFLLSIEKKLKKKKRNV